jgi:hypothetical protein
MTKLTTWLFVAAVAWIPTVAGAGAVYSYTGNGYTTFNTSAGYSASNKITLSLEFSDPLDANGCFASVAGVAGCMFDPLISFSISDGQYDVSGAPNSAEFAVLNTTNGAITSWEAGYVAAFENLQTIKPNGTTIPGSLMDFSQTAVSCGQNCLSTLRLGSSVMPGTWGTPVPIPGAAWLMLSGIGGFALFFRRSTSANHGAKRACSMPVAQHA